MGAVVARSAAAWLWFAAGCIIPAWGIRSWCLGWWSLAFLLASGPALGPVIALFLGPRRAFMHRGVLWIEVRRLIPRWASAQCWCAVVIQRKPDPGVWPSRAAHEDRHVTQWCWFGPLFPLAYGAASVYAWARGGHYYRDNWLESDARAEALRSLRYAGTSQRAASGS